MTEIRNALRALGDIGQNLPNHKYRERIAEIIKATHDFELEIDAQIENAQIENAERDDA